LRIDKEGVVLNKRGKCTKGYLIHKEKGEGRRNRNCFTFQSEGGKGRGKFGGAKKDIFGG